MNETGISNLSDRDITEVSGGQLQRASICCAIINNPDIIFDDKSTGALNSKTTLKILKILRRVNEESGILAVVTRGVKVTAGAEWVIFMRDGGLVEEMKLGKYHHIDDEITSREIKLTSWLMKMAFRTPTLTTNTSAMG